METELKIKRTCIKVCVLFQFYNLKLVIVILLANPPSYKTNNYVLRVLLKIELSSRPKDVNVYEHSFC